MNTTNFLKLVNAITGREFSINTKEDTLLCSHEYLFFKILPITGINVSFKWITPKKEEKFLSSFITAFCNKYKEPDPKAYDWIAKTYGEKAKWEYKTEKEKEYAHLHHSSNMYNKKELLKQIEDNFNHSTIEDTLLKYGFYNTEYGIGIFCFWETPYVLSAIAKMKRFLTEKNIPYANEYSDARWVYRFKINLTKETHLKLIYDFESTLQTLTQTA